jgi:hypothetical protein
VPAFARSFFTTSAVTPLAEVALAVTSVTVVMHVGHIDLILSRHPTQLHREFVPFH